MKRNLLNPYERALQQPRSLALAIRAKCWDCEGAGADRGWQNLSRIPSSSWQPILLATFKPSLTKQSFMGTAWALGSRTSCAGFDPSAREI